MQAAIARARARTSGDQARTSQGAYRVNTRLERVTGVLGVHFEDVHLLYTSIQIGGIISPNSTLGWWQYHAAQKTPVLQPSAASFALITCYMVSIDTAAHKETTTGHRINTKHRGGLIH